MQVEIWSVPRLSEADCQAMEGLYRAHYDGAPAEAFRRDLAAKERAILLRDAEGVRGFSTLRRLTVGGRKVLFSGDTVVAASCRNQTGLAGAFGHVMQRLAEEGGEPYRWLLICKGARTYRFLPTFFRHFTPGVAEEPALAAELRAIASELFPDAYDPSTGVLHFAADKDRLRTDVLRRDPESVRFRTLNPGWTQGDELCCLAPLDLGNLNALGWRVIRDVSPVWYE